VTHSKADATHTMCWVCGQEEQNNKLISRKASNQSDKEQLSWSDNSSGHYVLAMEAAVDCTVPYIANVPSPLRCNTAPSCSHSRLPSPLLSIPSCCGWRSLSVAPSPRSTPLCVVVDRYYFPLSPHQFCVAVAKNRSSVLTAPFLIYSSLY
jgi:hypothetical protein